MYSEYLNRLVVYLGMHYDGLCFVCVSMLGGIYIWGLYGCGRTGLEIGYVC